MDLLLIEDDSIEAETLQLLLRRAGGQACKITHAGCLHDALQILPTAPFDAVLTDLQLPDSEGTETVAAILAANDQVPVIVLSGRNDEQLAVDLVQQGAQDYLVKGENSGAAIKRTLRYAIERKRTEKHIQHLAYYDSLTGLSNRAHFHDCASRALEKARIAGERLALLYIDLDDFKQVNDTLGHDIGDLLLKAVAERLSHGVRDLPIAASGERPRYAEVGRLGGDEFVALIGPIVSADLATTLAKPLLERLSAPLPLAGQLVQVTPSIGIALYPDDDATLEAMYKRADEAMYHAKHTGKGNYHFYNRAVNAAYQRRQTLEQALCKALANQQLYLEYQPQLDLNTGVYTSVKALLRWRHPKFGQIAPAEFIRLAEASGFIVPIGEWVIETACRQVTAWQAQEPELQGLRVAVNVAARQFSDACFYQSVTKILARTGVDPSQLEFELTEGVLLNDLTQTAATMKRLKTLGVRFAVDDFGTGYASLIHLQQLPLNRIKIDRAFIANIVSEPDSAALVKAMVAMAHSLNLQTVAEGVESAEQQSVLARIGCDSAQGYYLGRPMPPEQVVETICRQRVLGIDKDQDLTQVLLVDDDINVTRALARTLRRQGYAVACAASAEQALRQLALLPIAVIISDHDMPGMRGVELLRRVHTLYPDTVRILLSGRSTRADLSAAINDGAIFKFLEKPVDDQTVLGALRLAMRVRRAAAPTRQQPQDKSGSHTPGAVNQKRR